VAIGFAQSQTADFGAREKSRALVFLGRGESGCVVCSGMSAIPRDRPALLVSRVASLCKISGIRRRLRMIYSRLVSLPTSPYSSFSGRNYLGRGVHSCIRGLKDEYGCRKSS